MHDHAWVFRLAAVAVLTACGSDVPSEPLLRGTSVEIVGVPSDSVIVADGTVQLTAIVRSADGAEVVGAQPQWSSTDASRATVSADGRVVGVRPGEAQIRVNAAGATDLRAISVRTRVPVPSSGQPALSSTLLDGTMQITLGASAVPAATILHVREASAPVPNTRLLPGTAIELGPQGLVFGSSVVLALSYPASVAVAEQPLLRIHRLTDGVWTRAAGGSVDLATRRVSAPIARTGIYALLRPAAAASLRKDAGDGQRALAGTSVAIAPRVIVLDAEDRAVQGAVVRFSVSAGGGAVVGEATAVSDVDGRATLPGQWRLGPTAIDNALTAEVVGGSVAPVTFNASVETLTLVITRELAGAVSGRTATTQPRLEFRTGSGGVLPVSDGVTVELLNGTGALVGTLRAEAVNGVATFSNLQVNGSGAHQLRFTSGGRQVTGSVFTVTQVLASLQVLVQPAGAEQDVAFTTQPVIQLLDDAGLPLLAATEVTATIASGPGDLRGNRSVVSANGRAAFTNLRINNDGIHRLRFEAGSPARSVLSALFDVIED